MPVTTSAARALTVEADLDEPLSRWLWLVKWLLAIPHYIVLWFLWIVYVLLSIVALVSILVTGTYPRGIFDFNVGVLRWTWRVGYYAVAVGSPNRCGVATDAGRGGLGDAVRPWGGVGVVAHDDRLAVIDVGALALDPRSGAGCCRLQSRRHCSIRAFGPGVVRVWVSAEERSARGGRRSSSRTELRWPF